MQGAIKKQGGTPIVRGSRRILRDLLPRSVKLSDDYVKNRCEIQQILTPNQEKTRSAKQLVRNSSRRNTEAPLFFTWMPQTYNSRPLSPVERGTGRPATAADHADDSPPAR